MSAQSRRTCGTLLVAALCILLYVSRGPLRLFIAKYDPTITTHHVSTFEIPHEHRESLERLGLKHKKSLKITLPGTGEVATIHGRFLHITDLHPDPHYQEGSDISRMCHKGSGNAGKYGDAMMGCDSPMVLVEETIDWITKNLADKVDFIVWTGDNMRHDNDRQYPRTEMDIFDMNERIADLMSEKFGSKPIPSLGNNDVYPHNLFAPGPTFQTREFFKIWRPFVPQAQLHLFQRGVYFFEEVIPNKLAVLSINTLYLFQSNPLVDTCDRRKDPGYQLFLWLGYVLKEMRSRGMKVWLTGHVPPNTKNYDISCLRKYIMWTHEFRDVIIGGLYGHMNIDHFITLDSKKAHKSLEKKYQGLGIDYADSLADEDDAEFDLSLEDLYAIDNIPTGHDTFATSQHTHASGYVPPRDVNIKGGVPERKVAYMESLRENMYAEIKGRKKSGVNGERYCVVHVASSVVPTFNPGMRVWEYNITDLYDTKEIYSQSWDQFFKSIDSLLDTNVDLDLDLDDPSLTVQEKIDLLKKDKTIPPKMPVDLPLGPAYVPQLFTPERFAQYYLDLKSVNDKTKDFDYELEYTSDDKIYKMEDLTVSQWLKLGRKLGKPVKKNGKNTGKNEAKLNKLWKTFLSHTFMNSDYENSGLG